MRSYEFSKSFVDAGLIASRGGSSSLRDGSWFAIATSQFDSGVSVGFGLCTGAGMGVRGGEGSGVGAGLV